MLGDSESRRSRSDSRAVAVGEAHLAGPQPASASPRVTGKRHTDTHGHLVPVSFLWGSSNLCPMLHHQRCTALCMNQTLLPTGLLTDVRKQTCQAPSSACLGPHCSRGMSLSCTKTSTQRQKEAENVSEVEAQSDGILKIPGGQCLSSLTSVLIPT